MKHLLLGSGGIRTDERMVAWKSEVVDFLKDVREVLFVPFAIKDHETYLRRITELDFHVGKKVVSLHEARDPFKAIEAAECISVGGGNSFRLLTVMQQLGVMPLIRQRVLSGMPYVGVSAGSNFACPTIKTTNDMPILCPSGLDALGLIPFQINPHFFGSAIHYYENGRLEKYAGETREDRLREFHEENNTPVLGMYEGTILRVHGESMSLKGVGQAKLFRRGQKPKTILSGEKVDIS